MSPRRALSEFEGKDEWDQYKVKQFDKMDTIMNATLKKEQFDKMDTILSEGGQPIKTKEPGFFESMKALPTTAANVVTNIASFPFMAPQWAVGMQEKYSGKPYRGWLTKDIGGKTVAQHAQSIGEAIQGIAPEATTGAEKRQEKFVNLPFEALGKAGEFAGGLTKDITGSPGVGTLAEASVNLAPLFFGSKGGKGLLKTWLGKTSEAVESMAERGYKSALKPGAKYTLEEQKAMTQAGLKEGITIGRETGWSSLDTLSKKIESTTNKISEIVDQAQKQGTTVKTKPIIDQVDKAKTLYPPWEKSTDLENMKEYLNQRDEIPIEEARTLKQQIQRSQRDNYDKLSGLANEGEKAAGHAILDQMIQAHPKLENLGLQDKAMINLQQAIGRRIKTWSHRDLISVRMLVEYGTGLFAGSVYGHPWLGPIIGLRQPLLSIL